MLQASHAFQPAKISNVTQADAEAFCRWLTEREGIVYRLPTEEEWEFACRAGSESHWSLGKDAHSADECAWHKGNSGGRPHPVGQLRPNPFGLYDMHGNVIEWCANYVAKQASDGSEQRQSVPPENDGSWQEFWVVRNGAFLRETQWAMRSASRMSGPVDERPKDESYGKFYLGFRVVREKTPPPAVAPFDAATARKLQQAWAMAIGAPIRFTNSIGVEFALIPPGEFDMGSTPVQHRTRTRGQR